MRTKSGWVIVVAMLCCAYGGWAQNCSILLHGDDGHVAVTNPTTILNLSSRFTFSGWVLFTNHPSGTTRNYLRKYESTATDPRLVYSIDFNPSTGEFMCNIGDGISHDSLARGWDTNVWHHVAFTHDSTNGRWYIDGLLNTVTTNVSIHRAGNGNLQIGFATNWPSFVGQIDDVSLWTTNLSQAVIQNTCMARQITPSSPSLAGYWDFNGQSLLDKSTNGNNVIGRGNVDFICEMSTNYALNAGGATGGAVITNTVNQLILNTNGLSVALWFTVNGLPQANDSLIAKNNSSLAYNIQWFGGLEMDFGDAQRNYLNKNDWIYGSWYHIAFTHNGTVGKWYVNGEFDSATTNMIIHRFAAGPLYIGTTALSNSWPGMVDEVSIWTNVLSQPQIQDIMARQLNGNETGLVGYWNFDSGLLIDGTGKSGVGDLINDGVLVTDETNAWRIAQDGNNILVHTDEVFPLTPCTIQTKADMGASNWADSPIQRSLAIERIPFIFTNAPAGHTYYRGRITR